MANNDMQNAPEELERADSREAVQGAVHDAAGSDTDMHDDDRLGAENGEATSDTENMQDESEGSEPSSGKFMWKIPNFSKVTDHKLYSDVFTVARQNWRILIFPRGNNCNELSVYLDCADSKVLPPGWSRFAHFTLAVVHPFDPRKTHKRDATHRFFSEESDWGFTQFLKLSALHDPEAGYLNCDALVLEAEVTVLKETSFQHYGPNWQGWNYDSKKETGCVGLRNQGATCYMNSLLQALFHTQRFRRAVYQMPVETDEGTSSVSLALQQVFYDLQFSNSSVGTKGLTRAFGWDSYEAFTQHDVQELNRVLCDNLEEKMKGTSVEGTIADLFKGESQNFIECVNVDYSSRRTEPYYDLSLTVKGCEGVYDSFKKYVEVEMLDGDNQYQTEKYGMQDARMGVAFRSFPKVLHLHLKRFEYDIMRDAMVKVNDRYNIPVHLDLNQFLTEDADRSVSNEYSLHSVLVHVGDLHGGHYYGYIRPTAVEGGQWLKFDDERVVKVTEDAVLDDSVGGFDEHPTGRRLSSMKRYANAYMLVYVRDADRDDVLKEVTEEDIPKHLRERFEKERKAEEARRKERAEAHLYCTIKYALEDDMRKHHGVDLVSVDALHALRIKRERTVGELREELAAKLNISSRRVQLWTWVTRQNKTHRPDVLLSVNDDDRMLQEAFRLARVAEQEIFVRVGPEEWEEAEHQSDDVTSNDILLFIKSFDPATSKLAYKGCLVVQASEGIVEAAGGIKELAGFPSDSQVLIYEEVRPTMIDALSVKGTFREAELDSGDILCVQLDPPTSAPDGAPLTVPEYFDRVVNQVNVRVRKLSDPDEEGVSLPLSRKMLYDEVAESVAKAVNVRDPMCLSFTAYNKQQDGPRSHSIRRSPDLRLTDMLSTKEDHDDVLYYEVLPYSVLELETKSAIKVEWHNRKTETEAEYTILVPKDGTLADVAAQLKERVNLDPSTPIQIVDAWQSRIAKILPETVPVQEVSSYLDLFAEEVTDDQLNLGEDEFLFNCVHFCPDAGIYHFFGNPFRMKVTDGETVKSIMERIRERLEIPESDFSKWKPALVSYGRKEPLKPEDTVSRKQVVPNTFFGLEHADANFKNSLRSERAVKIYN